VVLMLCSIAFSTKVAAQATVDLNTHVSGTAPAGTTVRWFATTPPPGNTTPLTAAQIAAAPNGQYYVAYYDAANNCYSPASLVVVAINTCPATTVNLNTRVTGTPPAGTSVVWYTNNAHTGTALTAAQVAAAGAGTYFAFYFDAGNTCYSPPSAPVVVAIGTCCNAGNAAPVFN
jgi:hypothetical protein